MTGTELAAKVKAVLTKVKACDADVYLRVRSSTGGSTTINAPTATSNIDTLLVPRPALSIISLEDVQGSNGALMLGDMLFLASNVISPEVIKTGSIYYNSSTYRIIKLIPIIFDGVVVGTEIYVRSVS